MHTHSQYTKHILLLLLLVIGIGSVQADGSLISSRALADSLNRYANFPTCVPRVRVKNLRVNSSNVVLYTNKTLSCLSLSEQDLTYLRGYVSRLVLGNSNGKVSIYSDNYELRELITDRFRPRQNEAYEFHNTKPLVTQTDRIWEAKKGLDEKTIALWPSHGIYYNHDQQIWRWQRATMWTMVEDLYTADLANRWLVPMLENAGAYVMEPRARVGMYYRVATGHEGRTAVIRHQHGGSVNEYQIRTDAGGNMWHWLSADTTGTWIADDEGIQIRLMGNDLGSIARGGQTSGYPRWMEGARYWLEYVGYPDSIWNRNGGFNDYKDDLQCRGAWVNYVAGGSKSNPRQRGLGVPVHMSLALHTDGYSAERDSDYIGTLAIYTNHDDNGNRNFPTGESRLLNRDLADYVQTQLVEDIRRQVEPRWVRRELNNSGYHEARYPVVPGMLLEAISHKNFSDIQLGLQPDFQVLMARAIYKGIGRWMQGDDFVVQPLPIHAPACSIQDGQCVVTWQATTDSIEPTASPDYYIVYLRRNNGDWDGGQRVNTPHYTFPMQAGTKYDIRIAAGNAGGLSLKSEIISASMASSNSRPILIVNNFHQVCGPEWFCDSLRAGIVPGSYPIPVGTQYTYVGDQFIYDKKLDWIDDDNCGWGMCYQDHVAKPLTGNTFDYPAEAGNDFWETGSTYVSCSIEALNENDSTTYSNLIIYCGQQRGGLFPTALRQLIERQIAQGGNIIIRGRFLGSGLKNAEEKKWVESTLGYQLRAPKGTHAAPYTNAPDALAATKRAFVLQRFEDTRLIKALRIEKGASVITIISE